MPKRSTVSLAVLCAFLLFGLAQSFIPGVPPRVLAAKEPAAGQFAPLLGKAKQGCTEAQLNALRDAFVDARGGWYVQLAPVAYQAFNAARTKYYNYATRCAVKLGLDLNTFLSQVTAYDASAQANGSQVDNSYKPKNPDVAPYQLPVATITAPATAPHKAELSGLSFDGTPGTAAPPTTLFAYPMTAFPTDSRAESVSADGVNSPLGGAVVFSSSATHYVVGSGWNNWSHSYTGDVYAFSGNSATLYMPPDTRAFYFYAEGNGNATVNFTATANDGTSSYPVSITTPDGAKYFGFYAPITGADINYIDIHCSSCPTGFAVGEFGIYQNAGADLSIVKYSEPHDTILAGETFTYTIFVDNLGPDIARNVIITDTLLSSAAISIQSCAFSVSQGGGSITQFTCTTGNLVSTQFGTDVGTMSTNLLEPLSPSSQGRLRASFRLVASEPIDALNSTRVTSDTFDPNLSNNYADDAISVIGTADLNNSAVFGAEVQTNGLAGKQFDSNAATAMPDPACCNFGGTTVTAGRRIQWDSSATNNGPYIAKNAKIVVSLPFGTSLIENTLTGSPNVGQVQGRCITNPDGASRTTVECDYGDVEKGATAALRFLVLVDPALSPGTQLSFAAKASSDTVELNNSNNLAGIQFDTNAWGDLSLSKTANGAAITDSTFYYEYDIANKGPAWSRDVTLSDDLPPEVDFVNAFIDPEGDGNANPLLCTVQAGTLLCPLGDIKPTGTEPIKVYANVHVKADTPDGTNISDTATLLMDTPDPLLSDNTDSVILAVSAQDLMIVKTAPALAGAGEEITYNLAITNSGPLQADKVQVMDYLPAELKLLTLTPDQGSCTAGVEGDPQRPTVCDLGSIPSNTTVNVVVAGKVLAATLGDSLLVNDAQVSGDVPEASLANNIDSVTTLVNATCTSAPNMPTQLSPVAAALIKQRAVLLDWSDSNCAGFYRIAVRKGAPNGPKVASANHLKVSQYTTPKLDKGFDYYWRARACNGIGCVNTPWQMFHVKP